MDQKITIYSTPSCGFCKLEKAYLDEKSIAYTDIDIAADPAEAEKMVEKTGQMGVPVTVIEKEGEEEQIMVGFDQVELAKLLGIEA